MRVGEIAGRGMLSAVIGVVEPMWIVRVHAPGAGQDHGAAPPRHATATSPDVLPSMPPPERCDACAVTDRRPTIRSLGAALAIPFLAGAIGTPFVDRAWYRRLSKPSWAPAPAVFGPVWTTLYAMLGLSSWLVWRRLPTDRPALVLYATQLGLNALWTPVFFGARRLGAAAVVIVLLWLVAAAAAIRSFRVRTTAGLLYVPYLAWVAFATALNLAIWRRRP